MVKQSETPGVLTREKTRAAAGAREAINSTRQSPQIALVEFDQSALEQRNILLLKSCRTVMLFLIEHIRAHLLEVRSAHGKSTVAFLPREAVQAKPL